MIDKIIQFYDRAQRTAILAQDNTNDKWYLVFSVIELLTNDIPDYTIPLPNWYDGKLVRSSVPQKASSYTFYLIVEPLSTPLEAWKTFQQPLEPQKIDGMDVYPFGKQYLKEPNSDYPLILPSTFNESDSLSKILPKRHSGIYVWTQIDTDRTTQEMFSEMSSREAKAISQLTNEWLGFDLTLVPEHIGNQYLSAVNPYFRDFDLSLSLTPLGINYQFYFRNGIREKLYARVIDTHGDHLALDRTFEIHDEIGTFEMPHEPQLNEVRIYNEFNDLIGFHQKAVFMKSISINMSMKSADLHVKFKKTDHVEEHFVEKFVNASKNTIGDKTDFNPSYYFKDAEKTRDHIRLADSRDFIFFKGSKVGGEKAELKLEAKKAIRDIINQAQDVCYLCDPYFNINDLVEYAFYSRNASAELRIVNCKGSKFVDQKKAKDLLEGIKKYNENFTKISCQMLRGDSILHDRFIVSDKKVWFIGSSFSEFGNRATCIARVPESADREIAKEIEKWYFNSGAEYSVSIDEYVNSASDE